MKLNQSVMCVLALLLLAGCENDPVGDAAKTAPTAPVEEKVQPVAEQAAVQFEINGENSSIEFVGAKITGKHEGKFTKPSGNLSLVDGDPTKSSVTVSIDMSSFSSDSEKLDEHLKSPDFFDVAKFPQTTFVSTSVAKKGDVYEITGNLDLHGIKKSITFPAQIEAGSDKLKISAEFGINRKDYGIVYPGKPDDLIKDEVLIKLSLNPTKR